MEPIEEYYGEESWEYGGTISFDVLVKEIKDSEYTVVKEIEKRVKAGA